MRSGSAGGDAPLASPSSTPLHIAAGLTKRWVPPVFSTGVVFVAVFLFYQLIYRVRHFSLPLGFDAPWYVWRAEYVAALGVGPLDTAARPGHSLLSADLQSLTGLSALQMHVVLPYALTGVFALAIGALFADGLGRGEPWRWAVAAGVAGALVGTTRLVGENVANLLNLLLVVAAFVLLLRFVREGRGFIGSVLMLLAAGLAHWLFLGVFGVVMAVWFVFALFGIREERLGTVWESEPGALAAAGGITGAAMLAIIYPVLHSQLRTFEIHEAKRRYIPKFREDVGALRTVFMAPVAALGAVALATERHDPAKRPFLRMLLAWTLVAAGGAAVAAATKALPPHRFFTLLVAGPVVMAVAAAVAFAARWLAQRAGRVVAVVFAAAAIAAVAIPAGINWYSDATAPKQFFDATAFQQAREASAYIEKIPPPRPVVFVVSPSGFFGPISTAEAERTIRAGLTPEQQERAHVYPGRVENLLAGRPTLLDNAAINKENRTYWLDVRSVVHRHPVVLVLSALAPQGPKFMFQVAPGVAQVRGPMHVSAPRVAPLHPVPTTEVATARAMVLFALLFAGGIGWTVWFVGRRASPFTTIALSPAVGAGMLMLASLVTVKLGLELGSGPGVATYVLVAIVGLALAVVSVVRGQPAEQRSDG